MPRQSKAAVAEERGLAAFSSRLSAAGYERRPDLKQAVFLSNRGTLFGDGGVEVAGGVEPGRGRNGWIFYVSVVLYSARTEEVINRALENPHPRSATVSASLMELLLGRPRADYRVEVYDPTGIEDDVDRIVGQVGEQAEGWYAQFDDIVTGEKYLFDNPTRDFRMNHNAGLVAALERGDIESAHRFSAALGNMWKPAIGQEYVERSTNFYRRIGEQYGVELPLVTWDEVRART